MAKTPVTMKIDGYKDREVMMVSYDFEQETDVEGQMSGIPRGRPAGLDDRAQPPEERQHRVPRDKDRQGYEDHQVRERLLRRLRGEVGRQGWSLRGDHHHLQEHRGWLCQVRERVGITLS